MQPSEHLYTQAPHSLAVIDTFILSHLLYGGPKPENALKVITPRSVGTRNLSLPSYQVKVHRSLTKLLERGLVNISSTKKTHGGLESKTYAINEFGMAVVVSGPTFDTVLRNAQYIVGDLYAIADANPQLLPFAFGLLKQIKNEEDRRFMQGFFLSFFTNTLGNALLWSAEDSDKIVLYNLLFETRLVQVREMDRIGEADHCTIPGFPQRFFERLFIYTLFDLDKNVAKGEGFQLLVGVLRRNNVKSKDIEILRGVFEKLYHERQEDLQRKQESLALFNDTFPAKTSSALN